MKMKWTSAISAVVIFVAIVAAYEIGQRDGAGGRDAGLMGNAVAAEDKPTPAAANFPRTGAVKNRDLFYYPGTEDLEPDEMRVTACGSGMPLPRLNQAAPCFLVELGNGDKFIFDIGTGAAERLMALQIPLDYINKVFIGHLHMDHMGDLPAFFLYGPQNARSAPLHVWGPGGGGTRPDWGMKASMEHMEKMWAWMRGTLVGTIDTRSFELHVTEFDWSKVNNVIYNENGAVIRTIPAIHFEQSVSFILEWNGLKFAFSSDTVPNKWWAEHTKGADLSIHECFFTPPMFIDRYRFTAEEALNASTLIHTSAQMFGKIMSITEPKHAVAYHFSNDPDTLPLIVDAVRETYSGPVDFAQDFMVWNVTKEGTRTRLGVVNPNYYPLPPLREKQMAEAADRYRTPEWIMEGLEPEVLPVIQKIYDDFNEQFGTSIPNPLKK
jgi:ribonuclease Z